MVIPPSTSPKDPRFFFCDSVSKSIVEFYLFLEGKKGASLLIRGVRSYIVVGVSGERERGEEREIPEGDFWVRRDISPVDRDFGWLVGFIREWRGRGVFLRF